MFNACHIAPSHRRRPHTGWTDAVTLVCDLLLGYGAGRYLGRLDYPSFEQKVALRGFSAGSFAGLWWSFPEVLTQSKLGAIACSAHVLHLFHYDGDSLCNWKPAWHPAPHGLLHPVYTFVKNANSAYFEHFGPSDHGYSHWLGLTLPLGAYELSQFLLLLPAAAAGAKRDATPLRLISWLRFHLDPEVQGLIDSAMLRLSTCDHVRDQDLLDLGRQYLGIDDSVRSVVDLRDKLVDLVSIRNLRHKPEALFSLFRQFMQRISLPRLVHFFDLVLPQLTPVQAWGDASKTLSSCHHIRYVQESVEPSWRPRVRISYFSSHDDIHHVRVAWMVTPSCSFLIPVW